MLLKGLKEATAGLDKERSRSRSPHRQQTIRFPATGALFAPTDDTASVHETHGECVGIAEAKPTPWRSGEANTAPVADATLSELTQQAANIEVIYNRAEGAGFPSDILSSIRAHQNGCRRKIVEAEDVASKDPCSLQYLRAHAKRTQEETHEASRVVEDAEQKLRAAELHVQNAVGVALAAAQELKVAENADITDKIRKNTELLESCRRSLGELSPVALRKEQAVVIRNLLHVTTTGDMTPHSEDKSRP
jgi:hypothetical protein